jgi:hypothetical protein
MYLKAQSYCTANFPVWRSARLPRINFDDCAT